MSEGTPSSSSDAPSGSARKFVLFGILGLLLVALAYDYRVARPSVDQAYDQIAERSIQVNSDSTQIFTNTDVRKLLGKEPSKTFQDTNGDTVEVFSWRSGLPIKTHDLYTVYKNNDGNKLFYRHAKYKFESSTDVAPNSAITIIEGGDEIDGESIDALQQEASGDAYGGPESGGGGPGGGGPGGGGPGGGGPGGGGSFDPEARFAEQDEDGDGFLKGDEISERAQQNMEEIDTDGDDAISKDEFMARMEAMRARFGGGNQDGGEGPGRRDRPESESDDDASEAEPDEEAESAEEAESDESETEGEEADGEASAEDTKPESE